MNALALLYRIEVAVVAVVVTVLVGCARNAGNDSGQTVAYYRTHAAERTQILQACANDPGRLQNTGDCVSARTAARQEGVGSLRELPPMGLPRAPSGGDQSPGSVDPHPAKEER